MSRGLERRLENTVYGVARRILRLSGPVMYAPPPLWSIVRLAAAYAVGALVLLGALPVIAAVAIRCGTWPMGGGSRPRGPR